ncbi:hypothetical protein V6N13_092703 [Hibiscus sabdariffa]|uniref:Uncharacterized protein n=1 Tax=Hibiscus sabdariffa TaxID=183260 RepID=A0ABR2P7L4_9ROSI
MKQNSSKGSSDEPGHGNAETEGKRGSFEERMNKKEEISGCFNGPEVREDVESVENFLKAWKRSKRQTPKILERTKYLGTSVAESVHPPSEASKG